MHSILAGFALLCFVLSVFKYIKIFSYKLSKQFILLHTVSRVKDSSGALYGFVLQGKNIKAGTNSLTRRSKTKAGHAQKKQNSLDFQLHNLLGFNRGGWGVKNLDGLQKFINFAL
jgi:hypothetical protein